MITMSAGRPPIRSMIKDAVADYNGSATHKKIINWINEKYNDVNENTIRAQINACTVNSPSRVGMPECSKPREYDDRYDFLFTPKSGSGVVEFYEPKIHGKWTIMKNNNGKITIAQDGVPLSESSVEIFSFEKLKDVTEHHIRYHQSNYLEIAIRTLLDSENFTMEWDKIGKNVEKLNFGIPPKPSGFGPAAKEMCKEPPGQKVGIKCKYENGRATNTFSLLLATETTEEQIDELKAMCGKGIAQWHAKKMTEKDVE